MLTSILKLIYNNIVFKMALIDGYIYKLFLKRCGYNFMLQRNCRIYAPQNVEIGNNTGISHHTDLDGNGGLKIGDDVMIGPYTQIISADHRFDSLLIPMRKQGIRGESVTIGNDVWIGAHVVVLPGISIGDGSIIVSGSIVTKDIAPFSIAVGNPAKVVKHREQQINGIKTTMITDHIKNY